MLRTAMASALALAAAAPAAAQYGGTPYRPTDQYVQQQQDYAAQRQAYLNSREDYRTARADYDRRMTDWEAQRAAYDARYGQGSYVRIYPAPVWDESRWAYVQAPPGYAAAPAAGYYGAPAGAYQASPPAGYYSAPPPAGYYSAPPPAATYNGANTAYAAPAPAPVPVQCDSTGAIAGGLIGALAGGVLGSNVAGHHNKTEGAVIGVLGGGGLGALVGHAHDTHKCDQRGAYWSYSDTAPYPAPAQPSPNDAYYTQMGCRMVSAPVSEGQYQNVRVCPDSEGRYRVTS
jgi:hypothetical protein